MSNVIAYCLQVLLLVAGGSLLPPLFRLRLPKARLWFWQGLLAACLLLPFVQPRYASKLDLTVDNAPLEAGTPVKMNRAKPLPVAELLVAVYAAGLAVRAAWILLGLLRLRRYRRTAIDLNPLSPTLLSAQQRLAVFPEIRLSAEISSPVTFGLLKPVILLQPDFRDLNEGSQQAILAHELIHVRRRDWLFTIVEEIVRSVLWVHPAIWWLLGQIQLTREQVVDAETIEFTMSREQYLEALLAVASTKVQPDLALAPLFLKKRHLARRVSSILSEVRMSKRQVVSSLVTVFTLAFVMARVAIFAFPLESSAQDTVSDLSTGVSVDLQGHKLLHGAQIAYPQNALEKRIEGTIVLQLSLDAQGQVTGIIVEAGPEELRSSAVASAVKWHFANESGQPSSIRASVSFKLPPALPVDSAKPATPQQFPPSMILRRIEYRNIPTNLREAVQRVLPVREGDAFDPATFQRVKQEIRGVDEHLRLSARFDAKEGSANLTIMLNSVAPDSVMPSLPTNSSSGGQATAAAGVRSVRLGGPIMAEKLTDKVNPSYPALAKEARIQGVVRFSAMIGKDGTVQNLTLVSGHPLLVDAASAAVQQWKYRPTLLNGEPVEVVTTVDVNFTLLE